MSLEEGRAVARRFVEEHTGARYLAAYTELVAARAAIRGWAPGLPQPLDRAGHLRRVR
jgi:hypothetical protein